MTRNEANRQLVKATLGGETEERMTDEQIDTWVGGFAQRLDQEHKQGFTRD